MAFDLGVYLTVVGTVILSLPRLLAWRHAPSANRAGGALGYHLAGEGKGL
jgi:hypothetical protein